MATPKRCNGTFDEETKCLLNKARADGVELKGNAAAERDSWRHGTSVGLSRNHTIGRITPAKNVINVSSNSPLEWVQTRCCIESPEAALLQSQPQQLIKFESVDPVRLDCRQEIHVNPRRGSIIR